MASSSLRTSGCCSSWTKQQNKQFERALAVYDQDTPDRWLKIASAVGSTVDEVKLQYDRLVRDVSRIESGGVSFPYVRAATGRPMVRGSVMTDEEQRRFRNLRI